jgi:hypothetical protein
MPSELTTKQQREARRAEKVAALKKQQAAQKRNRIITFVASGVAAAGVLALVIAFVVTSSVPKVDPASIDIAGLQSFDDLPSNHVTTAVDYEAEYGTTPPAGGNHNGVWLNCGVYTEVQPNENAVHALEHGAVWVTYNADELTPAEITKLQGEVPSTFSLVTPYPDLPAPVVVSAWGEQVQLDGVDDPRLADFITKFWKSADAPEPNAPCTGGLDGPGKIS